MSCFGLGWFENLLIECVWIAVVVGVLYILVPWVFSMIGWPMGPLMQILKLIVTGIIVIFVIVVVFELLGCMGGGHLGFFPRQ
jgi:hypothetical protein